MKYGIVKDGKILYKYGFKETQANIPGGILLPVEEATGKGKSSFAIVSGKIVETIAVIQETEDEKKDKDEKKKKKKKDDVLKIIQDAAPLEYLVMYALGITNVLEKKTVDDLTKNITDALNK
jgi:hypothetical protein